MQTNPASGLSGATPDATNPLVFDLLEWLATEPRPYGEVMDVWRTSCPRLTIWEDAVDLGYVVRRQAASPPTVFLTPLGRTALEARQVAAEVAP